MTHTKFGTRAEEFTHAIESGPPYVVRYHWAGGTDPQAQEVVTEAIAACFGVKSLMREQTIRDSEDLGEPLRERVRYLFWLLRTFDLSLGFTHGWDDPGSDPPNPPAADPPPGRTYRLTLRVDRSRARGYPEEF